MTGSEKPVPPPLVFRMAAKVAQLPKRGIEDSYKGVMNRLRRFSAVSIVEAALQLMWNPPTEKVDELRTAPWLTLLLVKWALQDKSVGLRVGASIAPSEIDQLRQRLWDLQGVGVSEHQTPNVWLMLRSILHVQFEFQRSESWGFLRWPALYARLDYGSTNRKQFRDVMGMEPNAFLDLAYGLYAAVLARNMPLTSDWLAPFRSKYGTDVDRMYELLVRDLPTLRAELQSDAAQRIRGKQELYEFPYLRLFPLVRLRDGRIHCWHPLVFARGLEDAVHLRLSHLGKPYVDAFSRVFERYVTELATGCEMPSVDEARFKAKVGGDAPSVEVILSGNGCNILVEAKMSLFADDVLLQDDETAVFQKTKRLREGIRQGWRVGAILRDSSQCFDEQSKAEQDFLFLVTSRELLIGNGDALQRMYPSGTFDYPNEDAARRLPLSNVFIVSIEDFEHTMGCVVAGEIDLSKVLKEAALANQRADTARMFFSDFLGKYTKRWTQASALRQAREESELRVVTALGGSLQDLQGG